MEEYIVNEKEHLSPVVVVATIVLVGAFVFGVLYRIVLFLL